MHAEYVHELQTLQTALRSARLEDVVEIEGPNKMGGYRLAQNGIRRAGLARVPNGHWYVSLWLAPSDDADADAFPGLTRSPLAEVVMGPVPDMKGAILTAVEFLIEDRVTAAWKESEGDIPFDWERPAEPKPRRSVFRTARAFRPRAPLTR